MDYDRALLEGKSRLEALYAQFTPTPEEFARRKRENEELRRASAAPDPATAGESGPAINPQPYYGPYPPPTSRGLHTFDPWKVQTC